MTQQNIFSAPAAPAHGVAVTMSSREIAELTSKRHDHVMRDIRAMLVELHGEGGVPKFGDTYLNEQNGQSYPVFKLPKRETLILVSGYSVELRARIIDRWQELEAAVSAPAVLAHKPPAFIETLAAAVDRGLLSKRSAVARLDALMGITLPRRAPRVVEAPVQLPLSLPAPASAPVPKPKAKPAARPAKPKINVTPPLNGFSGLNFVLAEAGQYVVGGEPVLRAAMLAHGLIDTGAPTSKGRGLVAYQGPNGHHWRLGALFAFLEAVVVRS